MGFYGVWQTWKIVYIPNPMNGGMRGVAFVEAGDRGHAMQTFRELYDGEYITVESCQQV